MMPLAMVSEGKTVKIKEIDCGRGLYKRLCDMGLYVGTKVKVIKNDVCGPVIVKVLDSKLAIGRGQAQKIMVDERG